jgi:glutaconyl-CoA/methylmalonyl-CoA decarboxylase subunit gamma
MVAALAVALARSLEQGEAPSPAAPGATSRWANKSVSGGSPVAPTRALRMAGNMRTLELTVDGRPFRVEIQDRTASPVTVLVNGKPFEVDAGQGGLAARQPEGPRRRIRAAVAPPPDSAHIVAPMPGVVVEVRVKPGDTVSRGDPIAVLEAMKMKTAVRAERDGKLAEVTVSVGQTVNLGDILALLN